MNILGAQSLLKGCGRLSLGTSSLNHTFASHLVSSRFSCSPRISLRVGTQPLLWGCAGIIPQYNERNIHNNVESRPIFGSYQDHLSRVERERGLIKDNSENLKATEKKPRKQSKLMKELLFTNEHSLTTSMGIKEKSKILGHPLEPRIVEDQEKPLLFDGVFNNIINEKYRDTLEDHAKHSISVPLGAKIVEYLVCILPVCAAALLVHLLPEFGYLELSRDLINWTTYYISAVLAMMAGSHFGMGIANLGVMMKQYKGIWNLGRMGCALMPFVVAVLGAVICRDAPHDAIFTLIGGYMFLQVMDVFAHIYSLVPRWFLKQRLITTSTIIAALCVLVTSESQVYSGKSIRLKNM